MTQMEALMSKLFDTLVSAGSGVLIVAGVVLAGFLVWRFRGRCLPGYQNPPRTSPNPTFGRQVSLPA